MADRGDFDVADSWVMACDAMFMEDPAMASKNGCETRQFVFDALFQLEKADPDDDPDLPPGAYVESILHPR